MNNFISVDFHTHVSMWFLISMKFCTRIINKKKKRGRVYESAIVPKILCLFRIRNFWNIQLKICKITIIWWNKSKHIYMILPHVSYYPSPLWINDLTHFHPTYLEKDPVFLPLENRLHQPSYKMFCPHFGHVNKIKFFPSYLSETIDSLNRTADHSFFYGLCYYQKLSNEQLFSSSYFGFHLKILYWE